MTDVASSRFPDYDTWRSRLLNYVDEHATEIITDLADLVRIPSVSGSDSEIDIQHLLADRMSTMNLDVDTWQIALDETLAEPDFPGVEVARSEAWGVVGRVPGHGSGPSLMLNAHVDVVPPGDLLSWEGADPFNGRVTDDTVEGRGSCDMKAGLVASLWAVRGLSELKVPLRGDLSPRDGRRRGGWRTGNLRAAEAWLARGRMRDPRADITRYCAGQRRRPDVPHHCAGRRNPRLAPALRSQRD